MTAKSFHPSDLPTTRPGPTDWLGAGWLRRRRNQTERSEPRSTSGNSAVGVIDADARTGRPTGPRSGPRDITPEPDEARALDAAFEADVEAAKRDFAEQLGTTAAGRRLVELAYPDVAAVADSVVATVDDLADKMADGSETHRREAAAIGLTRIGKSASLAHRADLRAPESSRIYRWIQRMYRRIDERVRRSTPVAYADRLTRASAATGRALTVLASLFLIGAMGSSEASSEASAQGWFWAAALAITARIVMTGVVWHLAHFPGDTTPDRPRLTSTPTACVLDHACDAAVVAAIGGAVVASGHPTVGAVVIGSALFFVLATLYRLSGAIYGTRLSRLHLERTMRGGAILASLWLAALGIGWTWWSLTIFVFPTAFAMIEIVETARILRIRRAQLERLPIAAQSGVIAHQPCTLGEAPPSRAPRPSDREHPVGHARSG
ncbi:MAG: hypothetical protein AAF945_14460 [Actinomycetota bacterium]